MITLRRSQDRRHIDAENHQTWMTFDWENTADPLQSGFGALKTLNEEVVDPGRTFILHTHKDMVIVTYVHDGVMICTGPLEKSDLVETGDFLRTNAPAGTRHITHNASPVDAARVFQSAFKPGTGVLSASGEKKHFTLAERKGILKLIASPDGKEASLQIQQDVEMYSTLIHKGNHMIHELKPGRHAWLHVVKGRIDLDEHHLQTGDGAGFDGEISVSFTAQEPTEILLFDMP